VDKRVESVRVAFKQIKVVDEAKRRAEGPESALHYDLNKLGQALPEVWLVVAALHSPCWSSDADEYLWDVANCIA
jgi:hypothetical protein